MDEKTAFFTFLWTKKQPVKAFLWTNIYILSTFLWTNLGENPWLPDYPCRWCQLSNGKIVQWSNIKVFTVFVKY